MRSRGYPVVAYDSLQTAYYNTPTDLQKASYDVHLIDLVKNRQIAELRDCLAIGLSTNPCNAWGESVLHLVCRHGSATDVLQVFLGAGADVQVVDDYGRTPLHDACWSVHPCLDSIALLLDRDVNLLHMRDCRGALPLSYVPESHWANWMAFLSDNKDRYFPTVGTNSRPLPSPLTQQAPHTRPVLDPPRALPLDVARMVASGRMTPAEVLLLFEEDSEDEEDSSLDDDEENYDDNDEDYSYEEDGDDRDNSSTLCSDSYADDDMNASQDAETRNMNPHHDKASSCHRDQVQVPKSNAGMDGIGRNVGIADDEHSDDEDDSDFDDMDSEEDDDDSVLDEVVGRLGIARPYYYQKAHGNASDKIIEPQDDSPLPPMASVVVDDRVTQDFFRPLARDAERASCLSAFSKQIPTAEPLIQEHRNSSMTEELLEFSC